MSQQKINEIIEYFEKSRKQPYIQEVSIKFIIDFIKNNNNIKKVLEIGTFEGYSAAMMSTVAESVKTIEVSKENHEKTLSNIKYLDINNIEVINCDATKILNDIKEKFDLVLIDAMKKQYKDYFILSLKLLSNNGVIFADNTISHKDEMKDFFEYLENNKINYKELNIGRGLVIIKNSS